MKRYEACALLTKIAQNELMDISFSKEMLKARDIVVCSPNKILDVLATDEIVDIYRNQLVADAKNMSDETIFSVDIRKKLYNLAIDARADNFDGECTEMFLETRCKNCPNYIGAKK